MASKRRNEGSQPGNFVFSGLAAAVRDGADAVAGRYDAGRMPGCVGCLSRLRSGAGMAAGRIYWLGRFLGTACICGDVISTGGVLYSCVSGCFFPGRLQRRGSTDGWIFNPFIGAGDGEQRMSVAESWFCIITGLTLPILRGCPNKNIIQNLQHMGVKKWTHHMLYFLCKSVEKCRKSGENYV